MNILSTNKKTKFSVNLPAGPETCNPSCPFYHGHCYAMGGRFVFGNVRRANDWRMAYYKDAPDMYFLRLKHEIQEKDVRHMRVFGSGDFPDRNYALRLNQLMMELPDVKFWVASYKAGVEPETYSDIVEEMNGMPNVIVRVSCQPKTRRRHYDYTSCVSEDPAQVTCPETRCTECGHLCWSKKVKTVTYKFKRKSKKEIKL